MANIKRILLECTNTYESDMYTGIQRVVRNIINESKEVGNELNVKCQPIILKNGIFLTVPDRKMFLFRFRAALSAFLRTKFWKLKAFLRSYSLFRNIKKNLPLSFERMRPERIINLFLDILTLPATLIMFLKYRISPGKGDIILLLDSSWTYSIWPTVKHAKAKGALVGLVIYDIFQITQPNFFTPSTVERFQTWLDRAAINVDFFIAISKTTQEEVKKYLNSQHPAVNWTERLESFQLGAIIDKVAKNENVRDMVKKVFENRDKKNAYLTVGTIEPRKNHRYLLDAFDKIWLKFPNVPLCIVGRVGTGSEEVMARILSHPNYGTRLFMFHDLTDTELDYCYSHAKALLFPSHAEGFGLPIIESLNHGLPVFASNIPIHKEVGKTFCSYFDINDSGSLANMIIDIETKGKMPEVKDSKEYKLLTWKESCRELLIKAFALSWKTTLYVN